MRASCCGAVPAKRRGILSPWTPTANSRRQLHRRRSCGKSPPRYLLRRPATRRLRWPSRFSALDVRCGRRLPSRSGGEKWHHHSVRKGAPTARVPSLGCLAALVLDPKAGSGTGGRRATMPSSAG